MSYYASEKRGKGYLRSGFKPLERQADTSDSAMEPCYEFADFESCQRFCELLSLGLENIYDKYTPFHPSIGNKVCWISTSSQSHLRKLVIPDADGYYNDPEDYKNHYALTDKVVCQKAIIEMQIFANDLYQKLRQG